MRNFLISLIFFPIVLFGGTFAWVAGSQPKVKVDTSTIKLPDIGKPPESTDENVQEGWKVFTEKGCVYCHGPDAAGGVVNPNSVGGTIPALNKVYEGYSEEELKEKILEGVKAIGKKDDDGPTPPLHMPSWEGSLSDEELESIVAYLMSFEPEGGGDDEDDW